MYSRYSDWGEYVPVAKRKAQARKFAEKQAKKRGFPVQPVTGLGRKITKTFWGDAWCENLESYSDYANRLPRGRTYARNGSVVDLVIAKGKVKAIVGGSEVYKIEIKFGLLKNKQWTTIKQRCAGSIDSVMSLLQGQFDKSVMADLSRQKEGLFPTPREIDFDCDCPDGASMCKHIAAVLYGIGARLDNEPEMLFQLRGVDHLELITSDSAVNSLIAGDSDSDLAGQDLGAIFGIEFDNEIDEGAVKRKITTKKIVKRKTVAKRKPTKKKAGAKKVTKAVKKKKPTTKKIAKKKTIVKRKPANKKVGPKKKAKAVKKAARKKK